MFRGLCYYSSGLKLVSQMAKVALLIPQHLGRSQTQKEQGDGMETHKRSGGGEME